MTKSLSMLLVLCCVMHYCAAQSIYYDARTLKKHGKVQASTKVLEIGVTKANADTLLPLLFNYLSPADQKAVTAASDPLKKFEAYKKGFEDNPFVNIAGTIQQNEIAATSFAASTSTSPSSGQSLTTTVIDAVAKFLVKRTKQELTSAFFDDFEKTLDKQPDLQLLFPNTYTILRSAKNEIYNYRIYLPALQQAFLNDVDSFLDNGLTWTKSSPDRSLIKKLQDEHKPVYVGLKSAFFVGLELDRGEHPGTVLNTLVSLNKPDAKPADDEIDFRMIHRNLPPVLQTTNLFSQSLRSDQEGRYWIDGKQFKEFEDMGMLLAYFGLIYQTVLNHPICFVDESDQRICLEKLLKDGAAASKNVIALKNKLQSTVDKLKSAFQNVERDIDALAGPNTKKASNYAGMVKPLAGLVRALAVDSLLSETKVMKSDTLAPFYIEHLAALWADIRVKAYNAAIYEAFIVLDTTFKEKDNATLKAFLKYGTFIATVSTAESSDEVEAAIEAIVLPPGSASIKRKTTSNIALQAYVGLSPAVEVANGRGAFTFGVAAPIGVAFSWGGKHQGSSSIFVPIVDLGAVTSYRFNDQNTDELPELTFSNIFAPGLYYVYGIPRIPVSAGIGGQLGPQLRDIADGVAVVDKVNFAFKFFLAVDIPLSNFRTKSK